MRCSSLLLSLTLVACDPLELSPAAAPPQANAIEQNPVQKVIPSAPIAQAASQAVDVPASLPSAIPAAAAMPVATARIDLAGYQAFGPPWPKKLPGWAKEPPRFTTIDHEEFFVAVGRAKAKNQALAQTAAANRARADILRHALGSQEEYVEGKVRGSRISNTVKGKDGFYYVEVVAPVALNSK